jgi:hypothetical protein
LKEPDTSHIHGADEHQPASRSSAGPLVVVARARTTTPAEHDAFIGHVRQRRSAQASYAPLAIAGARAASGPTQIGMPSTSSAGVDPESGSRQGRLNPGIPARVQAVPGRLT